jgi:hypothetical protein
MNSNEKTLRWPGQSADVDTVDSNDERTQVGFGIAGSTLRKKNRAAQSGTTVQ